MLNRWIGLKENFKMASIKKTFMLNEAVEFRNFEQEAVKDPDLRFVAFLDSKNLLTSLMQEAVGDNFYIVFFSPTIQ
jgi:hypothetical protein